MSLLTDLKDAADAMVAAAAAKDAAQIVYDAALPGMFAAVAAEQTAMEVAGAAYAAAFDVAADLNGFTVIQATWQQAVSQLAAAEATLRQLSQDYGAGNG